MGKGQGRIQREAESRSNNEYREAQASRERLRNNPELQSRRTRAAARRNHISDGTIADAKDFVSNRAATAKRMENYETRQNLTKTGVAGLASNYADPTAVTLADKAFKDEFARDSAAQTEADAKEYIATTEAMENDVIATDTAIESGIMNSAFNVSANQQQLAAQIAAQRASVLPSILGGVIQGAVGVATNTNWFNRSSSAAASAGG